MNHDLVQKYNIPGPRYTSYPTVPYWDTDSFNVRDWQQSVVNSFWTGGKEISLYIHLPFCESLCTYCGCNTRITKNHSVEDEYISAVLKEWEMYLTTLPEKPIIKELHLGGGTPTFFAPHNLERLLTSILKTAIVPENRDYAFEGHPNGTTWEHLMVLYQLGFRRVSFGVQDFDRSVQKAIHRIQSFNDVRTVTELAREVGFTSVNFDLIYGLPKQTFWTISKTIIRTLELNPDRIAFYSYAHVPHLKPAQKSYEKYLPNQHDKAGFYELGKVLLTENGYQDVGMDHFALDTDDLLTARDKGELHRNFMGYSTQKTNMIIGLGVSSISDSWTSFAQNAKDLDSYYHYIDLGVFPIIKGHHLTRQDEIVRRKILDLICRYETTWTDEESVSFKEEINVEQLNDLEADGLVEVYDNGIKVTESGRPFIRNICMALDVRLWSNKEKEVVFSRTI